MIKLQLFVSIALFADFMVLQNKYMYWFAHQVVPGGTELLMSNHKICIILKDDKQVIPNSHGQHIMNNHLCI